MDGVGELLHEVGEPPGQLDPVAADVVERQRGAQPGPRIVGHGDPGQHPVDTESPGVVQEFDAVGCAVRLVESPPDIGLTHPGGDGVQVVVGEGEPRPHRCGGGQVEHLAGAGPSTGEGQQLRGDGEQRIRLDQGAVGQPDPQPVRRVRIADHLAQAETGGDQWCVGLDVRAHHQDVARLQGRVVGEQAEQDLAQHVDLAGRAVTGVHLHRAVGRVMGAALGADGVGGDVGLQPAEQGIGMGCGGQEFVGIGRRQAALQFAQVAAQGGQQGVPDNAVAGVLPARDRLVDVLKGLPERLAGVRQPQVQVVVGGQRAEQFDLGGRQPGVPEQ